jgi:hypothetical protein
MLGALLLGGAAAFLVSCGNSNGLLSSSQSSKLGSDLNGISQAVANADCNAAQIRSGRLRDDINGLPGSIDKKLLTALQDGALTVSSVARKACTEGVTTQQTLQTQTQTVPTTTTPTNTAPTTPTTQTTTPTVPTTPTETTPPATGTSPDGGAGTGNGAGSGGAGG